MENTSADVERPSTSRGNEEHLIGNDNDDDISEMLANPFQFGNDVCSSIAVNDFSSNSSQNPIVETEGLSELESIFASFVIQETVDLIKVLKLIVPRSKLNQCVREEQKELSPRLMRTTDASPGPENDIECELLYPEKFEDLKPVAPTYMEKLINALDELEDVLSNTACELIQQRTYKPIQDRVNEKIRLDEKDLELRVNLETSRNYLQQLEAGETELEGSYQREEDEIRRQIDASAEKIDSSHFKNLIMLEFTKSHGNAELQELEYQFEVEVEQTEDVVANLKANMSARAAVSENVKKFLNLEIENLNRQIELWTQRFNDDVDRREQEIHLLEEQIQNVKDDIEYGNDLLAERQVTIDEYFAEKNKAQLEAEYQEAVNAAATRIQSLWRGHAARQQFAELKLMPRRRN